MLPQYFYQLFSIHGYKNGHFIPLVYALLPGKSEMDYRNMWNPLIASFSSSNLQLNLSVIYVDFEISMHTVLKEFFPTTKIKCCGFHLGQAGLVAENSKYQPKSRVQRQGQ